MGQPQFRFTLVHQRPEGVIEFSNSGFDVSLTGWTQVALAAQQSFNWATGGIAKADGSVSTHPNTAYIGQTSPANDGRWHPGKYVIEILAKNTSDTVGATAPFQSLLNIGVSNFSNSIQRTVSYIGDGYLDVTPISDAYSLITVSFELTSYWQYIFFNFSKVGPTTGYEVDIRIDSIHIVTAPTAKVISEPDGWKDAVLKLERHPDYHSLVEYFEGSFTFYGNNGVDDGGIDFIKNVEYSYGPDANLRIKIEVSFNEGGSYDSVFDGILDLSQLQETKDNKMDIPIIRNDLWAKFINRRDIPVDLQSTTDLDGNSVEPVPTVSVNLTSQKIRQKYEAYLDKTSGFPGLSGIYINDTNDYVQFDWNIETIDEIDEKFSIPVASNPAVPANLFKVKYGGTYTITCIIDVRDFGLVTADPSTYLELYIKINSSGTPIAFSKTSISHSFGNPITRYSYSNSTTLYAGDEIFIYGIRSTDDDFFIQYQQLQTSPETIQFYNYLNIHADTEYPSTEVEAYYLHDAFAGVIERYGLGNTFYSEVLGRTDTNMRQYPSNGCYSRLVILKGLQLRGYLLSEKPASFSFTHLWNVANPILNLGFGYEDVSSQELLRLEKKSTYYDRTNASINIDNIREITREYDNDRIFKKMEIGYSKWQSDDSGGLDDPQASQIRASMFTKMGTDITIKSEGIAASSAIENTRRQIIKEGKDYKYDNDTFVISIYDDDVSPDRYRPETNEYFTSVTGLLNPSYRYNIVLSALHNFLRWADYFSGCLQRYMSSSFKFVKGEGNFDMTTDYNCSLSDSCIVKICDSIQEKQDISLATYGALIDYMHLPDMFTFENKLAWEEYQTIRSYRQKSIAGSQTDTNHKKLLIKTLEYKICHSSLKCVVWAGEPFQLSIPVSVQPPPPGGWDPRFDYSLINCNQIHYQAEYATTLQGWTSEGGTDIPASTLEALSGWDNAGIRPSRAWALSSTPDNSLNGNGDSSDWIRGEIVTVPGLTYQFSWQIEVIGADPTSGYFNFYLLDSSNNILASSTSSFSTNGVKSGTVTLSPSGSAGAYFAIEAFNNTPINSKSFEIQSVSLSGGTGSVDVALPSYAWNSAYAGSAKVTVLYEGYGVKNFVISPVTLPNHDTRVQIKYAIPVNNSNISLRFRIKDSGGNILLDNVFASDVTLTSERTAEIDITSASIESNAYKFEILAESTDFDMNDTIYITSVTVLKCLDLTGDGFTACYQDVLDYAATI